MRLRLALVVILLTCGEDGEPPPTPNMQPCSDRYVRDSRGDTTTYPFRPNRRTPRGTSTDDPEHLLDLYDVDQRIAEMADCLSHRVWHCALGVLVAPDWQQDGGAQFFPPGKTRGATQHGNILVVTPNRRSLKHESGHAMLGTNEHPEKLLRCAGELR